MEATGIAMMAIVVVAMAVTEMAQQYGIGGGDSSVGLMVSVEVIVGEATAVVKMAQISENMMLY